MISQQHRWRDVALIWWLERLSPEFPEIDLTNMPMLTSLELKLILPLPLHIKISIAQSLQLRRLYIFATNFDLMTGEEPLCSLAESAGIAVCDKNVSGSHALRIWLDILKAAPFLTEFIAEIYQYTSPPLPRAQNEPLIRLPNPRVLELLMSDHECDPALFIVDYVTLPNLQDLIFTSSGDDEGMKAEMLTSFIRRSLPPLTKLVLDWDAVHEELIITILHLLPTLGCLRLDETTVTMRFFHELTAPSNADANGLLGDEHTTICPMLETLSLEYIDFEEDADSWITFISMLKSRPGGLGKSNVIYLRRGCGVPTTVELSDLDENVGDSRHKLWLHVCQGSTILCTTDCFEF